MGKKSGDMGRFDYEPLLARRAGGRLSYR